MSQSWKTKIDNVRSTYPAVDIIPQVIDDVKFRGRKSVDDTIKDNDLRFAVDDEITDGLFDFGEDLFEDEHKEFLDEFVQRRQMLSVDNSHIYPIRQDVAIKYP